VLVWNLNELRQALMPTLEKMYRLEPESLPFRQAVDPILLQIPVSDQCRWMSCQCLRLYPSLQLLFL